MSMCRSGLWTMSEMSVRGLAAAGCLSRWQALCFLGLFSTPTFRRAKWMAGRTAGAERTCWLRLATRGKEADVGGEED